MSTVASTWALVQYIFANIYRRFEIQNVINLNMCHAPGD